MSNVAYGRRWSEVGAAPFRLWKATAAEGGITAPAIARLPKAKDGQAVLPQFTSVQDILPTLLQLSGIANPGQQYRGKPVNPISGVSLLPLLQGKADVVRAKGEVFADEVFGSRYVRRDQWKLVWINTPLGNADWALYDLSNDRGESRDVAAQYPDIVAELKAGWDSYVKRVGVVLPDVPR